ncbi:uncharacterized protein LOC143595879 [Bidens hawaiensis]|uniref:uncharacterized protein LOC143595879 n=1 Tax=Bidens hawaiensis TaxID=980011 RepID=UPI00404AC43F
MAPPIATAQVPTIQAPPTNQAAPTPQGSNGRSFMMNVNQAQSSSDVVNGTFSINNHSTSVLFDTGAYKSFVSLDFAYIIDKPWNRLSRSFSIEVANGNSITIDSVIRDCVIVLNKVKFRIDLIPMQMGSFEVIVGMDWLDLPSKLSNFHPVFHVSNLKKCLAEGNFQIPLDEVRIEGTMHFVERPVEIMDHKDKVT